MVKSNEGLILFSDQQYRTGAHFGRYAGIKGTPQVMTDDYGRLIELDGVRVDPNKAQWGPLAVPGRIVYDGRGNSFEVEKAGRKGQTDSLPWADRPFVTPELAEVLGVDISDREEIGTYERNRVLAARLLQAMDARGMLG